ncbi:MAG TPA: hypothetical protein VHC94_14580 [Nitrobacter sp.]|nr:hypothetical protein [Nitrobacter sp.]
MPVTIRRGVVPLAALALLACAAAAHAQGAFPAPLPNGATGTANDPAFPPVRGSVGTVNDPAFPPVRGGAPQRAAADPAFPPVNGAAPRASVGAPASFPANGAAPVAGAGFGAPPAPPPGAEDCMKRFTPLREEAERRGKLIQAANKRHAPPGEACKLIGEYSRSEYKMLKFVETNQQKCGIPVQVASQIKTNHKGTETLLQKVCAIAKQAEQRGPAGPSLSDVLGSTAAPEASVTKKGGSTFDTLSGNVLTR